MAGPYGVDPSQFKALVIRPTLAALGLEGAENLVLGTALTESRLTYLRQLGGGPALGPYQCEPATHDDLWLNWLAYQFAAQAAVRLLMTSRPKLEQLVTNAAYATAICRLHYRRAPDPLPAANDAAAMADYHKRFYNTAGGATDPTVSVEHFRAAINA
jgi:hypothetical protein